MAHPTTDHFRNIHTHLLHVFAEEVSGEPGPEPQFELVQPQLQGEGLELGDGSVRATTVLTLRRLLTMDI